MRNRLYNGAILQIVLALFALVFGYRSLGTLFILLMAPFVVYMVVKQNALYLPALLLHCASNTSIFYLVFISMMIVCLYRTSSILKNKHLARLFWSLSISFPIFVILTWQKITLDGLTWQGALGYTRYYLSFWAALYGYLIATTFDKASFNILIYSIFVYFFIRLLFSQSGDSRLASMAGYLGILYGAYLMLVEKRIIGVAVGLLSLVIFVLKISTFSELLILLYSLALLIVWKKSKTNLSKSMAGVIPYIVILCSMVYGVMSLDKVHLGDYSDTLSFSSWQSFWSRAMFKFYGDRAIFWRASVEQLIQYKPLLPIHDIPDIYTYSMEGDLLEDISFGAHNSPLELCRVFGLIMGVLLSICYIMITELAANCLGRDYQEKRDVPLFIIAISNSIVLFLTGTAAMLPNFALFSFGLCGIAYGKYVKQATLEISDDY